MMTSKNIVYLLFIFSLLTFISIQAKAEDSCFCYKDKKENVLFNCIEFKGTNDNYATIRCNTKKVIGSNIEIIKVEYTKDEEWERQWERIESGKTDCDPCEGRPETKDVIKGDD
jgi:hypothetical protein